LAKDEVSTASYIPSSYLRAATVDTQQINTAFNTEFALNKAGDIVKKDMQPFKKVL